jgi:hypothetical protein
LSSLFPKEKCGRNCKKSVEQRGNPSCQRSSTTERGVKVTPTFSTTDWVRRGCTTMLSERYIFCAPLASLSPVKCAAWAESYETVPEGLRQMPRWRDEQKLQWTMGYELANATRQPWREGANPGGFASPQTEMAASVRRKDGRSDADRLERMEKKRVTG